MPEPTATAPPSSREDKRKDAILSVQPVTRKVTDTQGNPAALLGLLLAGGIGYLGYRFWKKLKAGDAPESEAAARSSGQASTSAPASKSKGGRSAFTFDKQPASAAGNSSSSRQSRSRQEKPKTQKQLRKEAKEAKKAAKKQAAADAEGAAVAAAIAKRAKELGMGPGQPKQQEEPPKQYYVDYEGVSKGYDKIVEWQQTGKKAY